MSSGEEHTHRSAARRWRGWREDLGVLLWSAFLAACAGTAAFFAYFDPALLADDGAPPHWLADRMSAHAVGFFFSGSCAASVLTAYLIGTRGPRQREPS